MVDVINEKDSDAGVTVDRVLLKDGEVAVGAVAFDDATSDPLIDADAAVDRTEDSVAHKDHVHPKHHAKYPDSEAVTAVTGVVKLDDLAAPDDNTDLDFSTTKHGLTSKGTNVGDFLKDDGSWATPAGGSGAVTREGGDTTEATTTSTSSTDMLDATSLTIAAIEPIMAHVISRKTTGAADDTNWGIDLNATVIFANVRLDEASNEIQHTFQNTMIPARVSNYLRAGYDTWRHIVSSAGTSRGESHNVVAPANDYPTVEITNLTVTGSVDNALITLGLDELHVYSVAAS